MKQPIKTAELPKVKKKKHINKEEFIKTANRITDTTKQQWGKECIHGGNLYKCQTCTWETVQRIVNIDQSPVKLMKYIKQTLKDQQAKDIEKLETLLLDYQHEGTDTHVLDQAISTLKGEK